MAHSGSSFRGHATMDRRSRGKPRLCCRPTASPLQPLFLLVACLSFASGEIQPQAVKSPAALEAPRKAALSALEAPAKSAAAVLPQVAASGDVPAGENAAPLASFSSPPDVASPAALSGAPQAPAGHADSPAKVGGKRAADGGAAKVGTDSLKTRALKKRLLENIAAKVRATVETAEAAESPKKIIMTQTKALSLSKSWACGVESDLFFLFANPQSGSLLGAKFIKSRLETHVRLTDICADVYVYACDDPKSTVKGAEKIYRSVEALKLLHGAENKNSAAISAGSRTNRGGDGAVRASPGPRRVRTVAVGGDGTFTGMIERLLKAGIDMDWIAAGIVPCGTGNDLANQYGWLKARFPSGDPLAPKNMEKYVALWRQASIVPHDSWSVVIQTAPKDGKFEKWNSKLGKQSVLGNDDSGSVSLKTFTMNNYFGIGFDGLVGNSFDKVRGTSQLWNKAMYGWAFLRHIRTSLPPVCDLVDTIYSLKPTDVALLSNNPKFQRVPGLKSCVALTFLNVRTICGGIPLWEETSDIGLNPPLDGASSSSFDDLGKSLATRRQRSGDGNLEVFSMASRFKYLRAPALPEGVAARVLQAAGPLVVTFKGIVPRMPMQVDGEYFTIYNLMRLFVAKKGTWHVMKYPDVEL